MEESKRKELYEDAIQLWGIMSNVMMVFEEMAELENAIAKRYRERSTDDEIITELADVSIMVETMAYYYGIEKFEAERERKLLRLQERVNNANGKNCGKK